MQRSEQINELATAPSKAQAEIQGAGKNNENPFFKSKYADLSAVWDACRKPLTKNGLSVTQLVEGDKLISFLMHSSGQFVSSETPILVTDKKPQSFGSAVSYMRRYALAAMVGIYQVDDTADNGDDDGETAQGRNHDRIKEETKEPGRIGPTVFAGQGIALPKPIDKGSDAKVDTGNKGKTPVATKGRVGQAGYISEAQINALKIALKNASMENEDLFAECQKRFGTPDPKQLTEAQAEGMIIHLESLRQ